MGQILSSDNFSQIRIEIYDAIIHGNLSRIKEYINDDIDLLNVDFEGGKNILMIAVERRHNHIVNYIFDELLVASNKKFDEIARILSIQHPNISGVNVCEIFKRDFLGRRDDSSKDIWDYVVNYQNKFALKRLIKNGFDISSDRVDVRLELAKILVSNRNSWSGFRHDIFSNKDWLYQNNFLKLCVALETADNDFFKETLSNFADIDLEFARQLFISLVVEKRFFQADIMLKNCQCLKSNDLTKIRKPSLEPRSDYEKVNFEMIDGGNNEKLDNFKKFAIIVLKLLDDVSKCDEYLSEIDEAIKGYFGDRAKLLKTEPEFFEADAIKWPKYNDSHIGLKKDNFLTAFLRQKLQKHNINDEKIDLRFFDFIDDDVASSLVRSNILFKEQFLSGISLAHGVLTHYLQWYLIVKAYEDNYLDITDCGLNVAQFMAMSVDSKIDGKKSWNYMIDIVASPSCKHKSLRSVFECNSHVLTHDNLLFLRDYMLNSFFKKLDKIHDIVTSKSDLIAKNVGLLAKEDFFDVVIAGQVFTRGRFNHFDLGLKTADLKKYYFDKDVLVREIKDLKQYESGSTALIADKKYGGSIVVRDSSKLDSGCGLGSSILT